MHLFHYSELLDLVSATFEQSENPFLSSHVRGTGNNKVCLATAHIVFHFGNPFPLPFAQHSLTHGGKIAKLALGDTRQCFGITVAPRIDHTRESFFSSPTGN